MFALTAVSLATAALAAVPYGDVITPVGAMPRECVHAVPHDARITITDTHTEVRLADGSLHATLPLCSTWRPSNNLGDDLPADYDGWLEYAAFQDATGFDSFLGTFSVPDAPKADPQVLYLFTGLQNINWIPKVDPEPAADFDIIQPVLQYPGDNGNYWSIKSWYVTLKAGALYSPEVKLAAGDSVFGNMTRTGPNSYIIVSQSVATKKATTIRPENARLASQPWAYVTLECYGCTGCSTYPVNPSVFSDMSLTLSGGGGPVTPVWQPNPVPAKDRKCKEAISIASGAEVTIFFDQTSA